MMNINDISNRTILRFLVIVSAFVGGAALIFMARRPLIWLVFAAFLAIAFNPAVEWLSQHLPRRSRGLAAGIVFILSLVVLVVVATNLVPLLVTQTQILIKDLPQYVAKLQASNSYIGELVRRYDVVHGLQALQPKLLATLSNPNGPILGALRSLFSGVLATITVLVLTFFLLVEGPDWLTVLWSFQSPDKRVHRQKLAAKMYKAVTGYVSGNLLTSLIAAAASALLLAIVGIPFAIPLGILVGILDLLPLVGATLASLVVVLISAFTSLSAALVMLIFFIVYQQLENHILQPLVYSRTVKMSPLMVLVSGILGVSLGGFLGALVAIPIAASLQILAKDYFITHRSKA